MSKKDVIMPKMGESVAEATIISWNKNIGDKIEIDETIIEIATDKVDSEVPSEYSGILVEKLFKESSHKNEKLYLYINKNNKLISFDFSNKFELTSYNFLDKLLDAKKIDYSIEFMTFCSFISLKVFY